MTDNEIIKALECCSRGCSSEACIGCPFDEKELCIGAENALQIYALDLINRQKAEISDLQDGINCDKETNKHLSNEYIDLMKECDRQKAEIERLKDLIINNDEKNLSYVATVINKERELMQIEHTRSLEAEIERLKNKLFDANEGVEFYKANFMAKCEEIDKVKFEAIKEFAERLKAKATEYMRDGNVDVFDIDNLVKEMTEKGGAE